MNWQTSIHDFSHYLRLEKNLSANTVKNYQLDLAALKNWSEPQGLLPLDMGLNHLEGFLGMRQKEGLKPRSQARLVSSLRSFLNSLCWMATEKTIRPGCWNGPKRGENFPFIWIPKKLTA